jgi:putative transposase
LINNALNKNNLTRDRRWTESIAVGSEAFVESIRQRLRIKTLYRNITKTDDSYILSEGEFPYIQEFDS